MAELKIISPIVILLCGGLLILLVGLFTRDKIILRTLSYLSIALAFYSLTSRFSEEPQSIFSNSLVIDNLYRFISIILLIGTFLTIWLSNEETLKIPTSKLGEYYALVLIAGSTTMLVAGANDLITLFLAIEAMSIACYILTGITRNDARSSEATVKYFIFGAFASGFLLYGMALLYGGTGTIFINKFSSAINISALLIILGLGLMLVGLSFKVGAVPFHIWVPDVYEGAPTAVSGFMATTVKVAGFGVILRVITTGFCERVEIWSDFLWGIAFLTMIIGNFSAIAQKSVKRMLAYSSIAHSGYALIGIVVITSNDFAGATATLFYLFIYIFMTLGAFAFLIYSGSGPKDRENYEDFAGLGKVYPYAGLAMAIFMLSLVGIPPTAGFIGKFYILKSAIDNGFYVLALTGILTSMVSIYYYLKVVVMMYMKDPKEKLTISANRDASLVVFITSIFVLLLGIFPGYYIYLSQFAVNAFK